ncbi:Endonuclease/exonuclease/phosphatase [Panaeolus papilionaceus]|nr:Endonuclease/exonuclease/phosphatase [Panaeolus papilionaceus]
MRVVTWNINGVRTLPQYHPWNSFKTFNEVLNHIGADIICFQEMKSSRSLLPKNVGLPAEFDSFFSFPLKKGGYSGVATYIRRDIAVALKAEEGISGCLEPKPPLTSEERISAPLSPAGNVEDDDDIIETDYKTLDSEGRVIITDLGLFVLINVYCPNDAGTPERGKFKMDFHRVMERRVALLIQQGREVVIVGDLNACAAVEDHVEGQLMVEKGLKEGLSGEEGFWGKEYRRSLRDWLIREDENGVRTGCLVDIVRKFWPERKDMFTCWNTKIGARATNYGTRIDFILITPGLVPWIKAADIQPRILGSDHCPVYVDFYDQIINISTGVATKLRDVLGMQRKEGEEIPDPPRIAAKFWDEYKQSLLSSFFGGSGAPTREKPSRSASAVSTESKPPQLVSKISSDSELITVPSKDPSTSTPTPTPLPTVATNAKRKEAPSQSTTATKKARPSTKAEETKASSKSKPGQSSLASFFSQPKNASGSGKGKESIKPGKVKMKTSPTPQEEPGVDAESIVDVDMTEVDLDADYKLALELSRSESQLVDSGPSSSQDAPNGSQQTKKEKNAAWNSLLAPLQPPLCTVHNEPAKEFTVNKPGPNKGKRFFICSRPVGPGYDKGRSERLREQVDPQWKCNFFKWSSEVKKEMMLTKGGGK